MTKYKEEETSAPWKILSLSCRQRSWPAAGGGDSPRLQAACRPGAHGDTQGHAGTRRDTRATREVVEVQGQFGAFPTSHLPASQPRVTKGLIQPKHAEGHLCTVPAGGSISPPLNDAQRLRSTSAVSGGTAMTECHRSHALAVRPWFWLSCSGSRAQKPFSTPTARDLVATRVVRMQ